MMLAAAAIAWLAPLVSGHAAMIMPPSRGSIDSELPPWHNNNHPAGSGTIQPYSCGCVNGSEPYCNSGQGCFWFSQGCTIGCSKCDGRGARIPKWDHCPLTSIKPTVNDPKYRSINQHAAPGSDEDIFFFNPWRAPGRAPVFDACGKAGGSDEQAFNAGEFNATKYAKIGDLGSKVLPKRPTGTVWHRGAVEKTRWIYVASHGGGYQYRLCPAEKELTEACFQQMPLKFAEPAGHRVLFKDRTVSINATVVPDSVTGTGDWMLNPIPSYDSDFVACDYVVPNGSHCDFHCPGCGPPTYAADSACPCRCAEQYPQYLGHTDGYVGAARDIFPPPPGLPDFAHTYRTYAIEDSVVVPEDIAPGEYVLGWRWDAEQTSQVWASCADITIA